MSTEPLGDAIQRMGRLNGLQGALMLTDAQLLDRFVARRDEPAFAALMVRHGPMVLCLCRQMLRDAQEAEDAFQAAFLVLVRNARSIRKRPSLGAWLYGVAYRVAARLRGKADRRRTNEQRGVDLNALPDVVNPLTAELRRALHDEVRGLPEKYREPVILCYLEGKTNEEAAKQLRWPVGTVKARLSRARELMRTRLARRGMTPAMALLTGPFSSPTRNTASILPFFLLDSTLQAAMSTAVSGAAAGGLATARAVGLAKVVAAAMQLAKLKATALGVLAACLLGAGTTSLSFFTPAGDGTAARMAPAETNRQAGTAPVAPAEAPPANVADAKTKPNAGADRKVIPAHRDDICKLDAVQRLKELVQQILLGGLKDRTPGLTSESGADQRGTNDLEAHPFSQPPAERQAIPDMNPTRSSCMDG